MHKKTYCNFSPLVKPNTVKDREMATLKTTDNVLSNFNNHNFMTAVSWKQLFSIEKICHMTNFSTPKMSAQTVLMGFQVKSRSTQRFILLVMCEDLINCTHLPNVEMSWECKTDWQGVHIPGS